MSNATTPLQLLTISAGTSNPSTTKTLTDQAALKVVETLDKAGHEVTLTAVELAPLAGDIMQSIVGGTVTDALQETISLIAQADGLIIGTPVYKAAPSGLFKSFIDLLSTDLLVAKPVLLTATGGSSRHVMVADDHLRPLFAFMRALIIPTSIYAAPEDWAGAELTERIERAAKELAILMRCGVGAQIAKECWGLPRETN
ncbi:CE1759 family FMN reductase [Canibacter zhoujuaniae]|uniref:CE1759 family FMN reductase n=1 Tax=Canibacter zhoujuaniae TaxID=2708343 RepID=UPI001420D4D6|nr:CE1759 family FMN reductase [Canibacter zhoujuaniae]